MGKRIVITGGTGYLGRHVVEAAIAAGHDVTVVARHADDWLRYTLPGASIIERSVFALTASDWARIDGADVLIHLAWRDGFVLRSRAHGDDLSSHYAFLMTAAEHGVKRIAPIGTMHEIGYWEGAVDAATPSQPTTEYGIAKVALRSLLTASLPTTGTELTWLRCYYIVGDDERSNSIFNKILAAAAKGDTEFPFTTGRNAYDFVAVDALARQIVAAVTTPGATGIIECGSGTPMTLADAVEGFIRERGLPVRLAYGAFPDRPFDSPGIWAATERIDAIIDAASGLGEGN